MDQLGAVAGGKTELTLHEPEHGNISGGRQMEAYSSNHSLDHEVHKLMLHHLLDVLVGHEEGDIVALDRHPPQDHKGLCTHHQETGELVREDALNVVGLLDADGQPDRVDGGFDQDLF